MEWRHLIVLLLNVLNNALVVPANNSSMAGYYVITTNHVYARLAYLLQVTKMMSFNVT